MSTLLLDFPGVEITPRCRACGKPETETHAGNSLWEPDLHCSDCFLGPRDEGDDLEEASEMACRECGRLGGCDCEDQEDEL